MVHWIDDASIEPPKLQLDLADAIRLWRPLPVTAEEKLIVQDTLLRASGMAAAWMRLRSRLRPEGD